MRRFQKTFNILYLLPLLMHAQSGETDSLKTVLKSNKNDTLICNVLNRLVEISPDGEWERFNEQLLMRTSKKLKTISDNNTLFAFYAQHYAYALNNCGYQEYTKGNLNKALILFEKGLSIQKQIKFPNGEPRDESGLANSLNNLAFIYQSQGNIEKALEYFSSGLKIMEKRNMPDGTIGDKAGVALCLNNIAIVYQYQNETAKALEFYNKSLKINENLGNKKDIANTLNNMASLYQNNGDPDIPKQAQSKIAGLKKAFELHTQSLQLRKEINDEGGIANTLNNIGLIYYHYGNPTQIPSDTLFLKSDLKNALEYFTSSYEIQKKLNMVTSISNTIINIAWVYFKRADINKSKEFADLAMETGKKTGDASALKNAADILSKIYQKQGHYKPALENYELYIQMRDSINNEETKKASIKNQLKYEYEKKAAADSVKAAEEKKVVAAQLKQEKTQRFALYGGLGLVGLFALFMVNRFRVTNKQKKLIEEQKQIVEAQKHLVEEKQKEILDSIKYAKRIQTALITSELYFNRKLNNLKN